MSPLPAPPPRPLPTWLVVVGSAAIAFHLLAITTAVLAAPSGPWATSFGSSPATPPQFAAVLSDYLRPRYLNNTRFTHSYRFMSGRPQMPGVYFEVKLKDKSGNEIAQVRIPDPNANVWVQHRQGLLARGLAEDQPVMPPESEVVAAPGQQVQRVRIWDMSDGPSGGLRMKEVPQHLVPRDRPVFAPNEWSLILARSYARYLIRKHDAATAEFTRHTQEAIPPAAMFEPNLPAGSFDALTAHFGELTQ